MFHLGGAACPALASNAKKRPNTSTAAFFLTQRRRGAEAQRRAKEAFIFLLSSPRLCVSASLRLCVSALMSAIQTYGLAFFTFIAFPSPPSLPPQRGATLD